MGRDAGLGLFVGGADGFAPVIGTEGFDVFHLGELEGLEEQGSARRLRGEKQIPRLRSG